MTQEPNRHVICYTCKDVSPHQTYGGATWNAQDGHDQIIHGTLLEANAKLAERIAKDTGTLAPDMFKILEITSHRLHSWHEVERTTRAPIPRPWPPHKEGELWEECPHCRREPVYMPLLVCDRCWPN